MTAIVNPFAGGGYELAEMTDAINLLPNVYTRLADIGLFRFEGITQRVAIVEIANGVLNLLPPVPLGGPATVANADDRIMRPFGLPWIPHDDYITPQDIQGIRAFGSKDGADPLATIMNRKLTRMRVKHAQTREYMEVNALKGVVKGGDGRVLYNYFHQFELEPIVVDFKLGTAATDVNEKCREVARLMEDELQGEVMSGVHVLISSGFFDKLIKHKSVQEAYKYYNSGQQILREDVRRMFPFGGLVFEEYNATMTLSTGQKEKLIADGEGIAFPMGTTDTYVTYGAPANLIETVNTIGLEMYARQIPRPDGTAIDIKTEASPLPLNKRPRLSIRLTTSD